MGSGDVWEIQEMCDDGDSDGVTGDVSLYFPNRKALVFGSNSNQEIFLLH